MTEKELPDRNTSLLSLYIRLSRRSRAAGYRNCGCKPGRCNGLDWIKSTHSLNASLPGLHLFFYFKLSSAEITASATAGSHVHGALAGSVVPREAGGLAFPISQEPPHEDPFR